MDIGMLAYKIHKGTITAKDYIAWSHDMQEKNIVSPSLQIIAALTPNANLFEIEAYFQKALKELELVLPIIEQNSRTTIALLANEILREDEDAQLAQLANEIFHIVIELNYPEDLIGWYDISEMQDQLTYDTAPLTFTKKELNAKIKEEARRVLKSN